MTGLYILLYFTKCNLHLYCVILYILYCPTRSEIPWYISSLHTGKLEIPPHVEYLKEPGQSVWNSNIQKEGNSQMRKTIIYKIRTPNLSCRTVTAQPDFLVKCHGQDKFIPWRTHFKKSKHFYTEWQKLMLANGQCSHDKELRFAHVIFAEIKVEGMKQLYHVRKSVVSTNACN